MTDNEKRNAAEYQTKAAVMAGVADHMRNHWDLLNPVLRSHYLRICEEARGAAALARFEMGLGAWDQYFA